MLLSYQPAFLFIHIDKAAGSSIQLALREFAEPQRNNRLRRRLTWLGPVNRVGLFRQVEFPEHISARKVRRCIPREVYAEMFKFAFVRNPWDRLVSRYFYLLRKENHPRHLLVKKLSFDDYVQWEIGRGLRTFQYPFVTDSKGELIVDFIGYFERLEQDFEKVCSRLKVKASLPKANRSSHKDYRAYYSAETRGLVAQHFKKDIELFGYSFDGLAN